MAEPSARWSPTQGPYPMWGLKITHGLHANEISNFHSSTDKPKLSNYFSLRNKVFQLQEDKINFLAVTSSRWGPTQASYPVWGPKIAHSDRIDANRQLPFILYIA